MDNLQKQYIPFTGKPMNKLCSFARTLHRMPSQRPSAEELINDKNEWCIPIQLIIDDYRMRKIVFSEKQLDKVMMKPLSHYIVIHKLWEYKVSDLSMHKRRDESEWQNMDQYRKVYDVIASDELKYESNLDGAYPDEYRMKTVIIEIIKHAFCVLASKELIHKFIMFYIQRVFHTHKWECIIDYIYKVDFKSGITHADMKVINWKHVKQIHAYHEFSHNEHFNILLYNVPIEGVTLQSLASSLTQFTLNTDNIIINELNDNDITDALIETINEWQRIKRSEFGTKGYDEFSINDDTRKIILELIGNHYGFVYVSKIKFLIYYEKSTFDPLINCIQLKCIFAATMGDTCISIFTRQFQPDNGKHNCGILTLALHQLGNGIVKMFHKSNCRPKMKLLSTGQGTQVQRILSFRP